MSDPEVRGDEWTIWSRRAPVVGFTDVDFWLAHGVLYPLTIPGIPNTLQLTWNVLQVASIPLLLQWLVMPVAVSVALTLRWDVLNQPGVLPLRWRVVPNLPGLFGLPSPGGGAPVSTGDIQQPVATTTKTP